MSYFRINVFDEFADAGVLDEKVVASGDVLHDVTLDDLVLEDGDAVVDQDWGRRRLEIRPGGEESKLLHIGLLVLLQFLHLDDTLMLCIECMFLSIVKRYNKYTFLCKLPSYDLGFSWPVLVHLNLFSQQC